MKLSTTAALFALAAAQGANAVDFDFRDFEGLWESPELNVVEDGNTAYPDTGFAGEQTLATFTCEATGDFRKAMCEFTAVIDNPADFSALCAINIGEWNVGKVSGQFILDQLDADTGVTKVMLASLQCCNDEDDPAGYSPRPTCEDSLFPSDADPSLTNGEINYQLTMLPGKSNNHVRALELKLGLGTGSDSFEEFEAKLQLRRTAGGFKSYD